MDVSSVSGIGTAVQTSAASGDVLGKDDFLSLLVTQLRHQDPLSPMDNGEFVAQLAQFSALEQMQNLNDNVNAQGTLIQSLNNSVVAALVGREVAISGNQIPLPAEGEVTLGFDLAADAHAVEIAVYDAGGEQVDALTLSEVAAGSQRIVWDGVDADGERLPAGSYTFEVTATDAAGNAVATRSSLIGRVDSIAFDNGVAYFSVFGMRVPLAALREVLADGAATTAE